MCVCVCVFLNMPGGLYPTPYTPPTFSLLVSKTCRRTFLTASCTLLLTDTFKPGRRTRAHKRLCSSQSRVFLLVFSSASCLHIVFLIYCCMMKLNCNSKYTEVCECVRVCACDVQIE